MIPQFAKLTNKEAELLLKAPVFVSVLVASRNNELSRRGQADAIRLAHLKTFTADPLLINYYKEVEIHFNEYFEETVTEYAPFDDFKRNELKKEIDMVNGIIAKLDKGFAITLHRSLTQYAEHVKRADRSLLENFIFPFPLPGITD